MRFFSARQRHPIQAVALSADGTLVATAQPHSGTTVWDISTGEVVQFSRGSGDPRYRALSFSPDGRWLAVTSSRGLELIGLGPKGGRHVRYAGWAPRDVRLDADGADVVTEHGVRRNSWFQLESGLGVPILTPARDPNRIPMGVSPNGRLLLTEERGADGELRVGVWARQTGGRLATLRTGLGSKRGVTAVARFAPTGDRVVVATHRAAEVFDWPPPPSTLDPPMAAIVVTPEPGWKRRVRGMLRQAADVLLGPPPRPVPLPAVDGWLVGVPLVGPAFRVELVTPPDGWAVVPAFAVTPDGTRLLGRSGGKRVGAWDLATGAAVADWDWGLRAVLAVAVSANGAMAAAAGRRGELVVWDLDG